MYLAPSCTRSRQYCSTSYPHPRVPSSLLLASETRVSGGGPRSQGWAVSCHVLLMSPYGMHRVYAPELFVTSTHRGKRNASNRTGRGGPAHYACCFTTTFERISLSELTTAAQVSSAEDSKARTVKQRTFRRAMGRGLMTRRNMMLAGLMDDADDRTDAGIGIL